MTHTVKTWLRSHNVLLIIAILSALAWNQPAVADSAAIDFEDPPYTTGNIHGQDSWSSSGSFDQEVFAHSLYAEFGDQSLRISNATTSGSFGDQTFAKPLTDAVGEADATVGSFSEGTRQNRFEMQFDIASALPGSQQSGLFLSVSPDRGDGSRMSYLGFEDDASGIDVSFYDVQGTSNPANFVQTIIATGLDRTVPHTLKLAMLMMDGPSNDVVEVYIDGEWVHTGTSWENYYRFDSEASAEQSPRIIKTVLFRAGGTAAPATAGNGFLIDNLELASNQITQCTTTCYVDVINGSDTFGGTSPSDAKKTIQAAVNQVDALGDVIIAPGIYNENVLINKSLTLDGAGAGTDSLLHTIIDGDTSAVLTGAGISLANGITNITISDLRVQDFTDTGGGGIRGLGNNNDDLVIESVHVDNNGVTGIAGGGIYLNGPVSDVTITNVRATNNKSRGIVIWNGFKQNITITNNYVAGNNCCGIELQDGTASGVTITGNVVENNTDSGMAFIGLTDGAGPNVISDNHILNNGRFGIEVKLPDGSGEESGDGSVVVANNFVTLTVAPADLRDLAGIAVFRRDWVVGNNNVDIPNGVIVKNNSVSGYQQPSTSEGFCIVVEGTDMQVLSNTVTSCDVGIQMQAGHTPYTANTNTNGLQDNLNDNYFGRGNSPVASGVIHYNDVAGNLTAGIRNIGAAGDVDARANWYGNADGPGPVGPGSGDDISGGLIFCPWLDDVPGTGQPTRGVSGIVSTTSDSIPYCTIQAAIDASVDDDTVTATDGTYNESPIVNESVLLHSVGGRNVTEIVLQSGPTYLGALTIEAMSVTVDGFTIVGADAVGSGLAHANIYITTDPDAVTIINNRIQVGLIGVGTNGDDGFGLITTYSESSDVDKLLVDNNLFEPVNTSGTRAFYINPGVDEFTFTNNTISGDFTRLAITQAKDGLVEDNELIGVGTPGIRSRGLGTWGYPDPTVYGHTIFRGNTISNTANAIILYETESVLIEENTLTNNDAGVTINDLQPLAFDISTIEIHNNNLDGNTQGIVNNVASGDVDARNNWWGDATGPGIVASGAGDPVSVNVTYCPWLDDVQGIGESTSDGGFVTTTGDPIPHCAIQPAIDASGDGDTVSVYPGDYNEVTTNRSVYPATGPGPYQFGLYIDWDNLTIQGVDSNGDPITDPSQTLAKVKTNATNNFGYSGILVQGDGVTIAAMVIQENFGVGNVHSNNKTIEILGDNFTLKDSHIDVEPDSNNYGGAVYFGDWQYDDINNISHIQSYAITDNIFDHGAQVAISNGAGHTGDVANRLITNNVFLIMGRGGPAISFNGAGGVPWYVYPVGAATITGNDFSGGGMYVRARGDYDNAGMNWTGIWDSNAFDRAVVTLVGDYATPFDVRAYSYTSAPYTFTNVRMIGGTIQPHISEIGQPDDTVFVDEGLYTENVVYDVAVDLKGSGSGDAEVCGIGDPDTQTIITAPTGNLIQLAASGPSSANKLLIEDIRLELQSTASTQYGIGVATNVDHIKLENVRIIGNDAANLTTQRGLVVNSAASITNWEIVDSSFNCLFVGVWFAKESAANAATVADSIVVMGSDFRDNGIKGMYVEKLANATIDNNEFIGNSVAIDKVSLGASHSAGLDINLKFASYSNITVTNNSFTDNGIGATEGAALMIKARDDGSYASPSASLANVTVTNNYIAGNERGIRFGEPDKSNAGPTQVDVNHNTIVTNTQTVVTPGTTYGGFIDWTTSSSVAVNRNALYDNTTWNIAEANRGAVDGICNWYGSSAGPLGTVANTVPFSPWLITSDLDGDCVLGSIMVNLAVVGSASYAPATWAFTSTLGNFDIPQVGDTESFTDLEPGTYVFTQTVDADYNLAVDCGSGIETSSVVTVALTMGEQASCAFTNTLKPATLTVLKNVINDHGGTASVSSFDIFVSGSQINSGEVYTYTPGTYFVTENGVPNYSSLIGGDCAVNGAITLDPGMDYTCTITNDDLVQGSLNLSKIVVGGSAFAPSGGWQFYLDSTLFTIPASGGGALLTDIPPGTYTVSEVVDSDYDVSFDCGNGEAFGSSTQITVTLGEVVSCTFTNTVKSATLTVIKSVINDNGGDAEVSDFPLFVDGNHVTSSVAISVAPGIHIVTENAGSYTGVFAGDCAANGTVNIAAGESKTCTITNNDPGQGTLNLTKVVVGGTASAPASGWQFFLGDTPILLPVAGGSVQLTDVLVGSYIISEVVDSDYTTSFSCGNGTALGSSTLITFTLGQSVNCTFTNTVKNATLTVNKVVVNDNGGTATADEFPLFVDGNPISNGVAISITPGTHTVSENAGDYVGSFSADCSTNGTVSLLPGESKTCTLTNNDPGQGTLNLTNLVVGSSDYAPESGWTFTLDTTEITIPVAGGTQLFTNVEPGTYTISQEADADYITTVNCGNGTTTATSVEITLVLGQGISCQFTNKLRDATLVVNKVVVNDDGGTAVVADFPLFVNNSPVSSGVTNTLAPAIYTVSENNLGSYSPAFSDDCAANGVVTLAPGESKSCTITNDDIAVGENVAAISLVKTVGVIEGVCATETTITVLSGETVYYCYTITNNGNVTLTEHTLVDSRLGTLIDALETDITPGQTITSVALGIEAIDVIEEATVNNATWTALATHEALIATASAAATVTLGIEDYLVTVEGTYIPPSGGGTTGGQMTYDINVLNTGTAILKNIQLTFIVAAGTTFAAGDDDWSCADGAPAGSVCTLVINVLEPGEDVDIVLNLDIIAEIDINLLILELNAETEGTPTSPTSDRGIVVVGPNAEQRTFIFMPALGRTDED